MDEDAAKQREKERDRERRIARLRPHCWKPGQSGNPKGRPKHTTTAEMYRKICEKKAEQVPVYLEFAKKLKLDPAQVTCGYVHAMWNMVNALKGNARLALEITNRMDGKVPDKMQLLENPLSSLTDDELQSIIEPPKENE